MSGYQELAAAVVLQAVKDYRTAIRRLKREPEHRGAKRRIREIECFIRSRWYIMLTDIDPDDLISQMRKEMKT